jgi:hypothetical protein
LVDGVSKGDGRQKLCIKSGLSYTQDLYIRLAPCTCTLHHHILTFINRSKKCDQISKLLFVITSDFSAQSREKHIKQMKQNNLKKTTVADYNFHNDIKQNLRAELTVLPE